MTTVTVENRLIRPSKIACIGRNYVDHIKELGNDNPEQMVIFIKPNTAISTRLKSNMSEPVHYEAELCFLCQNGRLSAVGFGLDLTKRNLQSRLKEKGLPWERAKAFDGSALFSQFRKISEVSSHLTFDLTIDGTTVQSGNIDLMIHKPDHIRAEISTFMTLLDGDIVMTGTPKGVGEINPGQVFTGTVKDGKKVIVSGTWTAE
ncbi:MAG: fumarylacetoacetate hydrolase family protein [Deltaproteobacteria bacterium]|nr:fumarylacetoacetate hydrolase family protein [Deltaproteobacteria bacterium]